MYLHKQAVAIYFECHGRVSQFFDFQISKCQNGHNGNGASMPHFVNILYGLFIFFACIFHCLFLYSLLLLFPVLLNCFMRANNDGIFGGGTLRWEGGDTGVNGGAILI